MRHEEESDPILIRLWLTAFGQIEPEGRKLLGPHEERDLSRLARRALDVAIVEEFEVPRDHRGDHIVPVELCANMDRTITGRTKLGSNNEWFGVRRFEGVAVKLDRTEVHGAEHRVSLAAEEFRLGIGEGQFLWPRAPILFKVLARKGVESERWPASAMFAIREATTDIGMPR